MPSIFYHRFQTPGWDWRAAENFESSTRGRAGRRTPPV